MKKQLILYAALLASLTFGAPSYAVDIPSPNGQRMAFVNLGLLSIQSEKGMHMLGRIWTNQSYLPTWHPNGDGIAYFRQKKIRLLNGRQTVAVHLYFYDVLKQKEYQLTSDFEDLLDIPQRADITFGPETQLITARLWYAWGRYWEVQMPLPKKKP